MQANENAAATEETPAKKPLMSIYNEFSGFMDSFESAVLATISKDGDPESSYAPIMRHDGKFYIYVSELSAHTFNLMNTPKASVLFIEPEKEAKHLFARKRATVKTEANHLERDSAEWGTKLDALEEKFGEIIQMLRPLEDFHLFELTPKSAGYVRGFAQAYKMEGEDLSDVTHLREGGHGKSKKNDN